jgi:hypothetical protein
MIMVLINIKNKKEILRIFLRSLKSQKFLEVMKNTNMLQFTVD